MNSLADIVGIAPKGGARNAGKIIVLRKQYNEWLAQGGDPNVTFEQFARSRGVSTNPYQNEPRD